MPCSLPNLGDLSIRAPFLSTSQLRLCSVVDVFTSQAGVSAPTRANVTLTSTSAGGSLSLTLIIMAKKNQSLRDPCAQTTGGWASRATSYLGFCSKRGKKIDKVRVRVKSSFQCIFSRSGGWRQGVAVNPR